MPDTERDETDNPPGERRHRDQAQAQEQKQPGPAQASPGLKDKDAPTSDTYGNTRESGEELKK